MSEQVHIRNKKVMDGSVFYLIEMGKASRWVDIADITDHLEQVIQYQKQINSMMVMGDSSDQVHPMEVEEQHSQKLNSEFHKQISKITFLHKNKQTIFFEVLYRNGSKIKMTNTELKSKYPQLLFDFYQKHIMVDSNH